MDFYRDFFSVPEDRVHIFVLIDGVGMNLFELLGSDEWLPRHFQGEMRSVYPSTTAVALSSLASLKEPGTLGVSGWTTWLPGTRRLVNVLLGKEVGSDRDDSSVVEESLLVKSAIGRRGVYMVNPAPFIPQYYMDWSSNGGESQARGFRFGDDWDNHDADDHWSKVTLETIREAEPGSMIYVYLPMVDSSSHHSGWDSPQTMAVLRSIQNDLSAISDAMAELPGEYRLAATADHGLLNVPREKYFYIDDGISWMKELECPFSGEGRNPVFHVKPGREEAFRASFEASPQALHYRLFTPEELVDKGYFPGGISAGARERWGTYIGLAGDDAYMEYVSPGEKTKDFAAVHGGDHPHERRVPLFRA